MLFDYVSSSEYDIDINAILEFYNSFNLIKPIDELVANWIDIKITDVIFRMTKTNHVNIINK